MHWRVFCFILKVGVFTEYYPNVACFKMLAEQVTIYSFCKKRKRILLNKLIRFFFRVFTYWNFWWKTASWFLCIVRHSRWSFVQQIMQTDSGVLHFPLLLRTAVIANFIFYAYHRFNIFLLETVIYFLISVMVIISERNNTCFTYRQ